MAQFLTDDLQRVGAHQDALQFPHALLGKPVSSTVGAPGPAERALRGAAETGAPGGAAGDVVARRVVDAPVGDPDRPVAPGLFEAFGKVIGKADEAHQSTLADDRVVPPRSAGEFLGTCGTTVGRLLDRPGEREEFVRPQPGGVGDQGREAVARVLRGGDHADLLRGVGPSAPARGLEGAHHRQPLSVRQPPGDVDQHGLQRLTVHVESLLAEIGGAASEVFHRGLRREVAQFESVVSDPPRDLVQAVPVVGDGAHRCRSGWIAAQCAKVDETADNGLRLAVGGSGFAELRQGAQPAPLRRSQRPTVEWQTRMRCASSQRRSSSVVAPAWRMAMSSLAKRSRREPRRTNRRLALVSAFRRATSASASKGGLRRERDTGTVMPRPANAAVRQR